MKYTKGLLTRDEANRLARAAYVDDHGNPIPNAVELVPIVASPMHTLGAVKDLQHPHELQNLSELETTSLAHAVRDAQNSTSRNIVLVPKVAAERFEQQFQRGDSMLRSIGKVTQQFRRTVLPYSTHWMMQIASEAGLRALIAGALDPRYLADGRRLMKRLEDTPEGRSALMQMANATFYNKRDPLAIYNPHPGVVAGAAKAFPPTRMLIAAHNTYADAIGQTMYSLEHNARLMGLGKLAHKEVASWGHAWQNAVRLQGENLAVLAEKLKADPTLVANFGREIDAVFGKYNKFTPRERAMIQSIAPFLPWYLNAAKFVLWHLPKDHPVSSALLASLRQTINQDIEDGKKAPLNAYASQELARITPFGIFSPPSTTPTLGNFAKGQQWLGAFLPQVEGSLYNVAGLNSFGEGPLKGIPDPNAPYGSDARKGDVAPQSTAAVLAALNNLFESFMPAARYVREAREGGGPAYGTSSVVEPEPKPGNKGTTKAVLKRMFFPFYSFEEEQKSKTAPPYASDKQIAAAKEELSGLSGLASGPAPATPAPGDVSDVVIPGEGDTSDVVIPGVGNTDGVVIP